jgi:hypothetical protein
MMQGVVNARHEGLLSLRVRGPSGIKAVVEALVDSAFTGSLTCQPMPSRLSL